MNNSVFPNTDAPQTWSEIPADIFQQLSAEFERRATVASDMAQRATADNLPSLQQYENGAFDANVNAMLLMDAAPKIVPHPEPIYCLMINLPKVGIEQHSRNPALLKFYALGLANHRFSQSMTALDWHSDFEDSEYPITAECGDAMFYIHTLTMIEDYNPVGGFLSTADRARAMVQS